MKNAQHVTQGEQSPDSIIIADQSLVVNNGKLYEHAMRSFCSSTKTSLFLECSEAWEDHPCDQL